MFKEIIGSGKRRTLLHDATSEVLDMLGRVEEMYETASKTLLDSELDGAAVVRSDKEINAGERLVRKMIFEHLTLNPDHDLSTSLALLSVVHDVERCGDYSKSLAEMGSWSGENVIPDVYKGDYTDLQGAILPLFNLVDRALKESDVELARSVMREHEKIKARSDELIFAIMDENSKGGESVIFALALRFLRRISAHLSNVASSIANPFDRIMGKENN
jgi:Na+/phosphate symporter